MKKILLIGKFNTVVNDTNQFLSQYFHVQLCSEKAGVLEGMLKIVNPDLIVISLVGAYDIDASIFYMLSEQYAQIPVLTIGTKEESGRFFKYYEGEQFENLIRPVENSIIMEAVCRRLGMEEERAGQEARQENSAHRGKKRILVVDDNGMALRTMKAMLQDIYEVALAVSGAQAMTSIGKKRPDLILLDYEMPVCDGRQALAMIRSDADIADIPVMFLTGRGDKESVKKVMALKPEGYLLKTMPDEAIKKSIDDFFAKRNK